METQKQRAGKGVRGYAQRHGPAIQRRVWCQRRGPNLMAEIVRVHPNQAGSEQYGRMSPGGCITIYVLHTHSHVLQAVITSHVNICDLLDAPYRSIYTGHCNVPAPQPAGIAMSQMLCRPDEQRR